MQCNLNGATNKTKRKLHVFNSTLFVDACLFSVLISTSFFSFVFKIWKKERKRRRVLMHTAYVYIWLRLLCRLSECGVWIQNQVFCRFKEQCKVNMKPYKGFRFGTDFVEFFIFLFFVVTSQYIFKCMINNCNCLRQILLFLVYVCGQQWRQSRYVVCRQLIPQRFLFVSFQLSFGAIVCSLFSTVMFCNTCIYIVVRTYKHGEESICAHFCTFFSPPNCIWVSSTHKKELFEHNIGLRARFSYFISLHLKFMDWLAKKQKKTSEK